MSNDTPPVQQLLEDTLAKEERRLGDLEVRVGTLRDSQAVRRPEPAAGASPGSATDNTGGLRELSVEDSEMMMNDAEVETARRLLAESGQQLRAVEEQLARLEAAPRDDDLRAAAPLPSPESAPPPATHFGASPTPSIDFPRGGYQTQAIRIPKHALEADRQTRVVVPHGTERYGYDTHGGSAAPPGSPDWDRLTAGQDQILARLSALEAGLAEVRRDSERPLAAEAARVVQLETRLDQVEAVCREVLRATRERSQQTQALAEGLAALQQELRRSPPPEPTRRPDPAPPLTASGQGRRLIARIRSGEYRRPEAGPDLEAIRAQLLGMGEEHQNLVQAHADLLERLLDLVD